MSNRRNHEWPQASAWDGFFTQDKAGGVTERVDPQLVKDTLRAAGFLAIDRGANLDDLGDVTVPAPTGGSGLVYDTSAGRWRERKVTISAADPSGIPADGDLWFKVGAN